MNVIVFSDAWKSNLSCKSRKEWIAKLASISYGNESAKDPDKLIQILIKRGHQSLFEFIRLPYLDLKSKLYVNYKIQDSLRHNLDLDTIESASTYYDKDKLIRDFKRSLTLLRIKVPIFVDRQLVRHRSSSRIEISRRYVKPDKVEFEYWFPSDILSLEQKNFSKIKNQSYNKYLQKYGRAELARITQPLNLYTEYYTMMDFIGARNFFVRRYNAYAQKETSNFVELELKMLKQFQPEFLGQKVLVISTDKAELIYDYAYILDLKSICENCQCNKLYVDYGDKHYYGVFDYEKGLFVNDILIDRQTEESYSKAFDID